MALTSPWAGYRWGPVLERGSEMTVLPASAPFDSAAEAPQPLGLVGANRSRRVGDGTEFAGIRPFHAGDRLRRINWRVSLRTGDLHVVTARGEEDSGVLLVVDALSDFGRSGGIGGGASEPRRDDARRLGAGRALRAQRRPGRATGGRREQ